MDSTLVYPLSHYSQLRNDPKKKVKELKARRGEISIGDYHRDNSHDCNTQSPFSKEILSKLIPHRFKIPLVDRYVGSTILSTTWRDTKLL